MLLLCCLQGKFVDWLDTKRILVVNRHMVVGAVLHAFCALSLQVLLQVNGRSVSKVHVQAIAVVDDVSKIVNISITLFVFARIILAIGEAGNFPAAIKATTEYFRKRSGFFNQYFNSGATIGALLWHL